MERHEPSLAERSPSSRAGSGFHGERHVGEKEVNRSERPLACYDLGRPSRASGDTRANTRLDRAAGSGRTGSEEARQAFLDTIVKQIEESLKADERSNHRLTKNDRQEILDLARSRLADRASPWFSSDHMKPGTDQASPFEHGRQFVDALAVMYGEKRAMEAENTHGADRYFHCTAHCEAASRGPGGQAASRVVGQLREETDLVIGQLKGMLPTADPFNAIVGLAAGFSDLHVNRIGYEAGRGGLRCSDACDRFRPRGMPPR
jgi:serum amyloid A protein